MNYSHMDHKELRDEYMLLTEAIASCTRQIRGLYDQYGVAAYDMVAFKMHVEERTRLEAMRKPLEWD